jgi:hypothetical protein
MRFNWRKFLSQRGADLVAALLILVDFIAYRSGRLDASGFAFCFVVVVGVVVLFAALRVRRKVEAMVDDVVGVFSAPGRAKVDIRDAVPEQMEVTEKSDMLRQLAGFGITLSPLARRAIQRVTSYPSSPGATVLTLSFELTEYVASSRFKGVTRAGRKWLAQITLRGQCVSLGRFGDEEDAARAYDLAATEAFGEYALLNFREGK